MYESVKTLIDILPILIALIPLLEKKSDKKQQMEIGEKIYRIYQDISEVVTRGQEITTAYESLINDHGSNQQPGAFTLSTQTSLAIKLSRLNELALKQERSLDRTYDDLTGLRQQLELFGGDFYRSSVYLLDTKSLWLAKSNQELLAATLTGLPNGQKLTSKQEADIRNYLADSQPSRRLDDIEEELEKLHKALKENFSLTELASHLQRSEDS